MRYGDAVHEVAALPEVGALAGAHLSLRDSRARSARRSCASSRRRTKRRSRTIRFGSRESPESPAMLPDGVEPVYADVSDPHAFSPDRFTHVFYAVGVTSDYRSRPHEVIASQLVGLEAFLEQMNPACRFVFVSSARVYGRKPSRRTAHGDVRGDRRSDASRQSVRLGQTFGREPLPLECGAARSTLTVARAANLYGLDSPRSPPR